jgi:hypothetical protein
MCVWQVLCNADWTAVGAVATVIGTIAAIIATIGVFYAAKQIRFTGWIEAQKLFTEKDFTQARTEVLKYFPFQGQVAPYINDNLKEKALIVCRQMDQLARLGPYLGSKTILDVWGYPLGKAWMILQATVEAERKQYQPRKWDAFEQLGKLAVTSLSLNKLNKETLQKKQTYSGGNLLERE